jgi:hypothetical protein
VVSTLTPGDCSRKAICMVVCWGLLATEESRKSSGHNGGVSHLIAITSCDHGVVRVPSLGSSRGNEFATPGSCDTHIPEGERACRMRARERMGEGLPLGRGTGSGRSDGWKRRKCGDETCRHLTRLKVTI